MRTPISALAGLFALTLATAASALDYRGEVGGIDHDGRTIIVGDTQFRVADDVFINDVVVGDHVVVSYSVVDGKPIVTAIRERSVLHK